MQIFALLITNTLIITSCTNLKENTTLEGKTCKQILFSIEHDKTIQNKLSDRLLKLLPAPSDPYPIKKVISKRRS